MSMQIVFKELETVFKLRICKQNTYSFFFRKKKIYSECFLNITQTGFPVCTWDLNYIKRNLSGSLDLIVFEKSNIYLKLL